MDENIKVEPDLQLEEPKLTNYAVLVSDFNEVCRTCLSTENALKSFKELIEKHNYSEDLLSMIGVDLSNPICLPQNICVNCINNLEHIKTFTNRSKEIHKYLYKLVESAVKIESSEIVNDVEEECNEQMESKDDINPQFILEQNLLPERKDEEQCNEETCQTSSSEEEDPSSSTSNVDTRKEEPEVDNSVIVSEKGKIKYSWNGYRYVRNKQNKEGTVQFWQCVNKNKGCKGRIWTRMSDGLFISEKHGHICEKYDPTAKKKSKKKPKKPFVCNRCFKTFPTEIRLKLHRKSIICGRTHRCDVCGIPFSQWIYLAAHKRQHKRKSGETLTKIITDNKSVD